MANLSGIPRDKNIELWKSIYMNCPAWLKYDYATLEGIKRSRVRKSFKGSKMVCAEFVSLIFSERPTESISESVKAIMKRSGWEKNITTFTEKSLALGGGAFKLYANDNKELIIDFVDADKFIPVSWNNEIIVEADFLSFSTYQKVKYLRVEEHRIEKDKKGYNIKMRYYRVNSPTSVCSVSPSTAGFIASDNHKKGDIIKTDVPLFSYFKLPEANNIDFESPKSISIFANCVDTLEGLDIAYDALQSEILLGRKRIIVPAQAIRKVTDIDTGNQVRYFDPSDEIFQAFKGDDANQLKIMDNSVELRIDEIRKAIQTYLDILSIQVGFSAGYLTFDGQGGLKTATEVISENSKTHKTKVNIQNNLSFAIDGIINSIKGVESLYKITVGDFSYQFQDNIIEDRNTKTTYWLGRLNAGTITLETFLINVDGLTEKEAKTKATELRKLNASVDIETLI